MSYDVSQLTYLLNNPPPFPSHAYSGRGIVISGGGSYLPSTYIAIKSLRHFGCQLPIQLWHLGQRELPEVLCPLFKNLGVELIDSFEVQKKYPFKNLGGWQNKPFAIVHSPFKEVFSFDADNFALKDPTFLFDLPQFKKYGAIFWPDFISDEHQYWNIKPKAWDILNLTPQTDAELEAGQVLINKEMCWREIIGVLHMNENSEFYYEHCSYGDKDTYTFSWALCNREFYKIPHRPILLEDMIRVHFDPDRDGLFQHSRKWVFPTGKNPRIASYQHEDMSKEWLREFEAAFKALI